MNPIDATSTASPIRPEARGRIYGVVVGVVECSDELGRVKLRFPWLAESYVSDWARIMAPGAGKARGLYLPYEPGDEVLVMFDHGSVDHPYVLGALWSAGAPPPAPTTETRVLQSKSGHTITLDDTEGREKITIADASGDSRIEIDATSVTIKCATFSVTATNVAIKGETSIEGATKIAGETSITGATTITGDATINGAALINGCAPVLVPA